MKRILSYFLVTIISMFVSLNIDVIALDSLDEVSSSTSLSSQNNNETVDTANGFSANKLEKNYADDSSVKYGDNIQLNDIIKYTIKYTGESSDSASEIVIADTITSGLEYISSSSNLGEPKIVKNNDGSTTLIWNTTIDKIKTESLTYSVKLVDSSYLTVSSNTIMKINGREYRLDSLINSVPKKEYSSDSSAGINGGVVTEEDQIKYIIKYANVKNETQTIVITDILSKGLTYVTKSSNLGEPKITKNNDGSTTLVWITRLGASSNGMLMYNVKVGSDVSTISSSASIKTGDSNSYKLNELVNPVISSSIVSTPDTASPLITTGIIFGTLFLIVTVYFVLKQFGINPLHKRF